MVTKGPTHYFLWLPHIRIYFRYNGYIDESDTQYKGITIDFMIFNTSYSIFIPTKKPIKI